MGTILKLGAGLVVGWAVLGAVQTEYLSAMRRAVADSNDPAFAAATPVASVPMIDADCMQSPFGDGRPVNLNRCHAEEESARTASSPPSNP